jgi:hypothetical protein
MNSEAVNTAENIHLRSRLRWCSTLAIAIGLTFAAAEAQAKSKPKQAGSSNNWLHFHRDNQITGWNPNETILTPATVASGNFGVVWESDPAECGGAEIPAHMYASPLFVEDVVMTTGDQYDGMRFSVVIAATNTNFVCAIAAADPTGMVPPGTVLWKRSIGKPSTAQLQDGIAKGIYGTPAIDIVSTPPRVYVVGDTELCDPPLSCRVHRGYALDLGNGSVLDGWPLIFTQKTIGTSAPPGIQQNGPTVFRDVNRMDERGALTLSPDNSILYVTFGSYPDQGPGFLVAVDTGIYSGTPAIKRVFTSGPADQTASSGGMWAPGGPALDADGNVYVVTGNWIPPQDPPLPGAWAETILVFAPVGPPDYTFNLIGTYTPWNHCQMDQYDADLSGSSTVLFDLDPSITSTPHLLTIGGKQGNAYLLDRDHMPGALDKQPPCHWDPSDPMHLGALDPTVDPAETSLLGPQTFPYYKAEDGSGEDRPGPINLFGPYQEDCHQGNLARGRTTPTYFKDSNGTAYVFFTGSTKPAPCSIEPQQGGPSVARTRVVTPGPNQHAYLTFDAYDDGITFRNPAIGVISSNGNDFSTAVLWLLDSNRLRGETLDVSQPILYAVDPSGMRTVSVVYRTPDGQLSAGGKYNTPIVVNGKVYVGTDRIVAYGLMQ